jgi:hypothetical protein
LLLQTASIFQWQKEKSKSLKIMVLSCWFFKNPWSTRNALRNGSKTRSHSFVIFVLPKFLY